ncbi:hypothetical protein MASR2M117_13660 [Paludibacter sp.]
MIDDFEEYIRQGEPSQKEKSQIWQTAIGLQQVDGLTPSAVNINATLDYDFKQEKNFKYKGLTKREIVEHIANFISSLWQIHAFGEGNTRTIAVFTIKYLRTFGFEVENDMFARHSWYFCNALVRANYNDYQHKVYATLEYLMKFFGNLLLGENNELKNRHLRVDATKDIVEEQTETLKEKKVGQKTDLGGQIT